MFPLVSKLPESPRLKLTLIKKPEDIDQAASRTVLVEAFVQGYEKYLTPSEVSSELTTWREGSTSAQQYYENYFASELAEFTNGHLDFWVQATLGNQLVGWATFEREKSDPNAVYMNLISVHPDHQRKGVGKQLVMSLETLGAIEDLSEVNLLLRKKNRDGREFYKAMGFFPNADFKRDNFVDPTLLEGFTWRNPKLKMTVVPNRLAVTTISR